MDIHRRDGRGQHQGSGCEARTMGTGKKDTEEVESTGERLGMGEKLRKEPCLVLRFLAETTGLKPQQPAPQRESGQEAGSERR